jgi:chitin disaccharide deacetylase
MTGLTITADDFGLCLEVNNAICLLHDQGIVQRTTLMANTEYFDASLTALRIRPALEVGIHLNLTDGEPVLAARHVPTLVNRHGAFRGGRHYSVTARILCGRMAGREIRSEWEAQIARARDAGVDIRHLSAHGHVHLLPPLHGIVADLLEQFAIPQLRIVSPAASVRGVVLGLASRGLLSVLRHRRLPVSCARHTLGLDHSGALDEQRLVKALSTRRERPVDLIVHPSLGRNEYHRRWGYAGDVETRALLSDQVTRLVRNGRTG